LRLANSREGSSPRVYASKSGEALEISADLPECKAHKKVFYSNGGRPPCDQLKRVSVLQLVNESSSVEGGAFKYKGKQKKQKPLVLCALGL
jgi:hypothetical protein